MTPLNRILELDCTKQYINAFQENYITIKDDEMDEDKKRTEFLNKRIKNKSDLEIIEKINKKFNLK